MSEHRVTTLEQLEALYGDVNPNSLAKETDHLTSAYKAWVEQSPFFALASCGPGGLDCSPRGDAAGQLIRILDDRTLLIPDRRGNNRLDTLKNIVGDPHIALMFMIPGITETLRINGRGYITTDPKCLALFSVNGKLPVTAITVEIDAVYFQCARALVRAGLWQQETWAQDENVPTAGQMTKAASAEFDAIAYDAELRERQKMTLY